MKQLRTILAAVSLLMIFVSCSVPAPKEVEKPPLSFPEDDPVLQQPSEISLERIHSGCTDCNDHSLTLRRASGDKFAPAIVTNIDLHTKKQRQGELSAYYYNKLLQLINSQGFMEMNDEYAMNWADALIVRMSVSIGDKRKTIRTNNQGEVPPTLWGIYMAVDGAVAQTKWRDQ